MTFDGHISWVNIVHSVNVETFLTIYSSEGFYPPPKFWQKKFYIVEPVNFWGNWPISEILNSTWQVEQKLLKELTGNEQAERCPTQIYIYSNYQWYQLKTTDL